MMSRAELRVVEQADAGGRGGRRGMPAEPAEAVAHLF